jgi:hypothetical protein
VEEDEADEMDETIARELHARQNDMMRVNCVWAQVDVAQFERYRMSGLSVRSRCRYLQQVDELRINAN